ncbi:hypothetical protein P3T27_004569 [Kitasatospora sp. MAA19]|nr:hypothetical protein [Kitasatospora sp. MAA19]MDH6707832.1 hypothetical protein [Kitasatospora sp. MAA19]
MSGDEADEAVETEQDDTGAPALEPAESETLARLRERTHLINSLPVWMRT